MAIDGLKMIHIAGYDGDPEEVFEGLNGGGLSEFIGMGGEVSSDGQDITITIPQITGPAINEPLIPSTSLPIAPIPQPTEPNEWGNLPAPVVTEVDAYFKALQAWLATKPFAGATSRGDAIEILKPAVPVIIGAVVTAASGGTVALPALASAIVTQIGMNLIDSTMEQALGRTDQNPLQAAFETAFLTDDNQSIVQVGLEQVRAILDQRLGDLAYVDETVDFGFCRVHIKGKMIEY